MSTLGFAPFLFILIEELGIQTPGCRTPGVNTPVRTHEAQVRPCRAVPLFGRRREQERLLSPATGKLKPVPYPHMLVNSNLIEADGQQMEQLRRPHLPPPPAGLACTTSFRWRSRVSTASSRPTTSASRSLGLLPHPTTGHCPPSPCACPIPPTPSPSWPPSLPPSLPTYLSRIWHLSRSPPLPPYSWKSASLPYRLRESPSTGTSLFIPGATTTARPARRGWSGVGTLLGAKERARAPTGTFFHQFAVPPIIEVVEAPGRGPGAPYRDHRHSPPPWPPFVSRRSVPSTSAGSTPRGRLC